MSEEKTIAIIIARMNSNRLPGKVLREVNEQKPLLSYTLERVREVTGVDEIWLATTQETDNEKLMLWGIQQGIHVHAHQGETDDVVGRISGVLEKAKATRFLTVLGDTPFPDPRFMNQLLQALTEHPDWESVSVEQQERPAVHSGVSCYRASAWQKIDQASTEKSHREHIASILREKPDLIQRGYIMDDPLYYEGPYRLTVDTRADFEFIESIAMELEQPGELLHLETILNYFHDHPEFAQHNIHVRQKDAEEESLKVLMAVQAGGDYGTGHLARCKSIMRALEEHFSVGVTFWVQGPDPSIRRGLVEEGISIIEGEWSLAESLRQQHFDRLVIDFQSPVTPSLIQTIRHPNPGLSITVIDNHGMGCVDVDALVLPNVHAKLGSLGSLLKGELYQGSSYVTMGSGFLFDKSPDIENQTINKPSILVTMGGRDPELMTEKVLESIKDLKGCHIDLVVPPMYPNLEGLEKIATKMPSTITLHWRITNLRPLMQRSQLAVAAFGVTPYELAFLGVPTLLLGHYEENVPDMERFCKWGTAINLGCGSTLTPQRLLDELTALLKDHQKRQEMCDKGKKLVSSDGHVRVAQVVMETVHQKTPVATS